MLKKLVSMLLTMTMVFSMWAMSVAAADLKCEISIFSKYFVHGAIKIESYMRLTSATDKFLQYEKTDADGDWNVAWISSGKGADAERKIIFRDLDIVPVAALSITDSGYDQPLILEIQGDCVLTNKALPNVISTNGKVDIVGTEGSSLKILTTDAYTGEVNSLSLTGETNLIDLNYICEINSAKGSAITSIASGSKLNVNNCTFDFDIKHCGNRAAIDCGASEGIVIDNSNLDIDIGNADEINDNYIDRAIVGYKISVSNSTININMSNPISKYALSMQEYRFHDTDGGEKILLNESYINITMRGNNSESNVVGIAAKDLTVLGGSVNLNIDCTAKNILGIASWGWKSFSDHTLNNAIGKSSIKNTSIKVEGLLKAEGILQAMSFQNEVIIKDSKVRVKANDCSGDLVGVYLGKGLIEEGKNTYEIYSFSDSQPYAMYFDNLSENEIIEFNKFDEITLTGSTTSVINGNEKFTVLFGEHSTVQVKEYKELANDKVTYTFVDSYSGTHDIFEEDDGCYRVVKGDPHFYSNCPDTYCDYEDCDYWYSDKDTSHTYIDGSIVCTECGYVSEVEIDELDAPVATKSFDTEASVSSNSMCTINSIIWTDGSKTVTTADYETAYTAKISLAIGSDNWIDDDTKVTVNGKVASIKDGVVEYTFEATEKKPTPTSAPTTTVEPTVTPTTEPTNVPTGAPTSTPTSAPTVAPTTTVVPTAAPTSTTVPTSAPTSTVAPTAAPTAAPSSTPTVAPTTAPELNVGDFINRCYSVALGREADEAGYNYWVESLTGGQACGAQVGYGFIFSQEYINKNRTNEEFVTDMYAMYFGREADSDGFNYWVDLLESGLTREDIMAGFANSEEFYNLCNKYGVVCGAYLVGVPNDVQGGVNCFVARLYKVCLNRLPDMGGQNGWVLKLTNGEVSGTSVAYGFVFSLEFIGKEPSSEEFVNYMYAAFFGREADEGGFNAWVETLNNGGSYEDVFNGFTGSAEFANLCAGYGINP